MLRRTIVGLTRRAFGSHVYTPEERRQVNFRNEKTGYYLHPEETARRVIRLAMMHPQVKVPEVELGMTFEEMGLDELSVMELMFQIEVEFNLEMPFDEIERFRSLRDPVEFVGRSFHAF